MHIKVCIVKAMVFPVVMCGCESWTMKKAECRRIDAFELWCWRRLLRLPWTERKSNQSIRKEISPEYSLERLTLKLKLQYFGYLMRRANSLEKTLMLDKIEGKRKRGWQDEMVGWHHQLNGHEFEQTLGNGEEQGSLACCGPWGFKELYITEQLNSNNKQKLIAIITDKDLDLNSETHCRFSKFHMWYFSKLSSFWYIISPDPCYNLVRYRESSPISWWEIQVQKALVTWLRPHSKWQSQGLRFKSSSNCLLSSHLSFWCYE